MLHCKIKRLHEILEILFKEHVDQNNYYLTFFEVEGLKLTVFYQCQVRCFSVLFANILLSHSNFIFTSLMFQHFDRIMSFTIIVVLLSIPSLNLAILGWFLKLLLLGLILMSETSAFFFLYLVKVSLNETAWKFFCYEL